MTVELLPHQQRVVAEHGELRERLDKLKQFMNTAPFNNLSPRERGLLLDQARYMTAYLAVLRERIEGFGTDPIYVCHKRVRARPMDRGAYNKLRGWEVPQNENPQDAGYLVEYLDGGERNHPDFLGYISWSPKDVFERGYTLETKK